MAHNPIRDDERSAADYWRASIRLILTCLAIWFIVSYGFGILLVDVLNNIRIVGFQLVFWFSQQGSIYAFLLVIVYYVIRMNKIDREFRVRED